MITCYPGNGSHYHKHCDNPTGNGRRVTCIFYLNKDWLPGDGGELKIYHSSSSSAGDGFTTIAPLLNRLVVFWSDMRCLHEVVPSLPFRSYLPQVLPSNKIRYALTLWFIDSNERNRRALLDEEEQGKQRDQQLSELQRSTKSETSCPGSLTLLPESITSSPSSLTHTFRIQFPPNAPDAFRNTELHVSESEIKITPTAGRSEISEFHLQLPREIFPNQTMAKFSKKSSVLSLKVHFK